MKVTTTFFLALVIFLPHILFAKGGPAIVQKANPNSEPQQNTDNTVHSERLNSMVLPGFSTPEIRTDLVEVDILSAEQREFKTYASDYTIKLVEEDDNQVFFQILDSQNKQLNTSHKIGLDDGKIVAIGDDKLGITLAAGLDNENNILAFYLWEHSDWETLYSFHQPHMDELTKMYTSENGGIFIENSAGIFEVTGYDLNSAETTLQLKEVTIPVLHR